METLSVCFLSSLCGEDSGFIPKFNLMHAWFFCFGSVYLFWVFDVWGPKFFCQADTISNLEKKLEIFHKKPV